MIKGKSLCWACVTAMCLGSVPMITNAAPEGLLKIETEVFEPSETNIQETEVVILMDSEPTVSVSEKKSEILRLSGEREKGPDFLEWIKGKFDNLIGGH